MLSNLQKKFIYNYKGKKPRHTKQPHNNAVKYIYTKAYAGTYKAEKSIGHNYCPGTQNTV